MQFSIYSKHLFFLTRVFARDRRKIRRVLRKHFPSRKLFSIQNFSKFLVWRRKRAVSAIKKAYNVFLLFGKFLAFAEEKREGVYIKHSAARVIYFRLFFHLTSDDIFTGTFFFYFVAAFSTAFLFSLSLSLLRKIGNGFSINLSYHFSHAIKRNGKKGEKIN